MFSVCTFHHIELNEQSSQYIVSGISEEISLRLSILNPLNTTTAGMKKKITGQFIFQ